MSSRCNALFGDRAWAPMGPQVAQVPTCSPMLALLHRSGTMTQQTDTLASQKPNPSSTTSLPSVMGGAYSMGDHKMPGELSVKNDNRQIVRSSCGRAPVRDDLAAWRSSFLGGIGHCYRPVMFSSWEHPGEPCWAVSAFGAVAPPSFSRTSCD